MGRNFYAIHQSATCLSGEELQRYLDGASNLQERHRVEHHMLDCPLCSDAVEGFETAGQAQVHQIEDFSSFKKKLPLTEGANIRQLTPARFALRAAAAVALLIVAAWGFNNLTGGASSDELYRQGYSTYPVDIPYERRGDGDLNFYFAAALADYDSGRFAQSIPKFLEALKEEPDNHACHFFAGVALLETARWNEAIEHFSSAEKIGGGYSEKVKWYLAMANLKAGKTAEAKTLLQNIVAAGKFKAEDARKLLLKM